MEANSKGQNQKQFRTDSTGEQVWGRRGSFSFSFINPSVLIDFFLSYNYV